jgi:hypothetical protein
MTVRAFAAANDVALTKDQEDSSLMELVQLMQ